MKLREFNHDSFEISAQADSMESLSAFFVMMHEDSLNRGSASDIDCTCIAHKFFAMKKEVVEKCQCGNLKVMEETAFDQFFTVTDCLFNVDTAYKIDVVLGNMSTQEFVSSSKLLQQKSFEEMLRKNKKCEVATAECENCGSTSREVSVSLVKIPKVYIIQLVWAHSKQNALKILQFLKGLNGTIDLHEIYNTERHTAHALKGIILHFYKHYVYCIKSEDGTWTIINDSFAKKIHSGRWFDVVEFFINFKAYPTALFYEESPEIPAVPLEIDEEHWLNHEKSIYFSEIFPKLKATSLEKGQWVCFYCYNISESREKSCSFCGNSRISQLPPWSCEECHFDNAESILVCDKCNTRRFYSEFTQPCCEKNSYISPGVCNNCNFLETCSICELPIFNGQTAICIECGQILSNSSCNCEFFPTFACRFCSEKVKPCPQCGQKMLFTAKRCQSCSFRKNEEKLCKFCRKVTLAEVCASCTGLTGVNSVHCVNCGEEIQVPVLFICPVCDREVNDEGNCEKCDYVVDYEEFSCGKCRKQVKRCLACGLGVMVAGGLKCSICQSTFENFK